MARTATLSHYMAMADQEVMPLPERYTMGVLDPSVFGLRSLLRYSKNGMEPVPLAGTIRMLTHKQMAMSGLLARVAVTGEHATITALAKEANVVPSTLSRFLDKLQCWNVYAIDVRRGRNGGITVRLRGIADQLAAYAERAWQRLRRTAEKALSRTKRNVASTSSFDVEDYPLADKALLTNVVLMDATFTEAFDAAERRGAVLGRQARADTTPTLGGPAGGFDPGRLTAENVIAERRWLDANEPDWEHELDKARERWLN